MCRDSEVLGKAGEVHILFPKGWIANLSPQISDKVKSAGFLVFPCDLKPGESNRSGSSTGRPTSAACLPQDVALHFSMLVFRQLPEDAAKTEGLGAADGPGLIGHLDVTEELEVSRARELEVSRAREQCILALPTVCFLHLSYLPLHPGFGLVSSGVP